MKNETATGALADWRDSLNATPEPRHPASSCYYWRVDCHHNAARRAKYNNK